MIGAAEACLQARLRPLADSSQSRQLVRAASAALIVPRPRVEHPVEQVGEQVEADEDAADDDGAAEHGVHVGVLQRIGEVEAEARPGEHRLGQHRAFEQVGIGQRDHRDQRHRGVAQRMAPDDPRFRQALGARRDDVFLAQLVQHEGAGHAADIGEREIAEQRGRQDDVAKDVAERAPVALDQPRRAGTGR